MWSIAADEVFARLRMERQGPLVLRSRVILRCRERLLTLCGAYRLARNVLILEGVESRLTVSISACVVLALKIP